jgi:hypothetical protein
LCIGKDDRILRWRKGSTILYNIYTESFQTPGAVALVGEAMEEAISMWGGNIGVDFRRVRRDEAATFQIAYQKFPLDNDPNTYAESFFPREWASSLFVYQKGLENAAYLANILAHELGHVLGLRHEFAPEEEEDCSVRFGNKNDQSVMNYFDHASKHIVGQQDLDELAAFYAYDQAYYREWLVVDITPRLYVFSDCGGSPQKESFCLHFITFLIRLAVDHPTRRWTAARITNLLFCPLAKGYFLFLFLSQLLVLLQRLLHRDPV